MSEAVTDLRGATVGVTGAGGFIGMNIVRRALSEGAAIRGLDVSEEAADRAREAGAEVVVGDVRDPEAVREFCAGCDVVFHTAAIVGEGGNFERYHSVNVDGTRNVVGQAVDCGVRRFVHLSSVMVYGFDFPPEVDESGPLRGEGNPYCQTKIDSERIARDRHGDGDLEVIVARPGDVYGPRSQPWVVRPLELMKSHLFVLPEYGRGKLDPTYVDNLVDALFLLLTDDRAGEVFNVTDGRTVETREFFGHHARMLGRSWVPALPTAPLRVVFTLVGRACRAAGLEPPATPGAADFLSKPHGYSDRKLREAGHTPEVSLDEGMARIEEWAKETGLV